MGKRITKRLGNAEFEVDADALAAADAAQVAWLRYVLEGERPPAKVRERMLLSVIALVLEDEDSEPDAGDE